MTLTIKQLISHRFRGFDVRENSLKGLREALGFGVKYLEFDIRVAACGTPMIWHDEYARDKAGKKRMLCDILAKDFKAVGGDFAHFPSFEDLLQTIVGSGNKDAVFLVDIKDAGFEAAIISLIRLYRLHDRVHYVSWLPEVLYAAHKLEPDVPLCLSHWCKNPDASIRGKHKVYTAKDGLVPHSGRDFIHGERSGWYVDGTVSGEMLDMLQNTKGSVCVPVAMVTPNLVAAYHKLGIAVYVFSYVTLESAKAHQDTVNMDLFFVDDKAVFDAL